MKKLPIWQQCLKRFSLSESTSWFNLSKRFALFITLFFMTTAGFGQAPTISYATPQNYTAGLAITPLVPTSSGVAAPGYRFISLGSGFNNPWGVAADAAGNVYVADEKNNQVKKIPVGGGAPVVIGSGFRFPTGVAVDAAGNVYVSEPNTGLVKKVPAGGGTPVSIGSGFSKPFGVAVDAMGNVYVADMGNKTVMEIPVGGGSEVSLGSGFKGPQGVAVDAAGNVYVADTGYGSIKVIRAGSSNPPDDLGTGLIDAYGVAVDAKGNVYIADAADSTVYEIPIGTNGSTVKISSAFNKAKGVAVDTSGNLYVGDSGNNLVRERIPAGGYYISPALSAGLSIDKSTGIISGTPIVVSPATNYTVTAYNTVGSASSIVQITVSLPPPVTVSYSSPHTYTAGTAITPLIPTSSNVAPPGVKLVAFDAGTIGKPGQITPNVAVSPSGDVYISGYDNGVIKKFPAGGGAPVVVGSGFIGTCGIAVDLANNIYVADYFHQNLTKIPAGGGSPVVISTAPYELVFGVAVDPAGNVYVGLNTAVEKIPVGGGAPVILPYPYGFGEISGLAADAAGNIYVSDYDNGGVIKVLAGGGFVGLSGPGSSTYALAVDAVGNVFLTDDSGSLFEIPADGGPQTTVVAHTNLFVTAADAVYNLYAIDYNTNQIEEFRRDGGYYISPLLPAGLMMNSSTGVISGTPTIGSATTNYTVTAFNFAGGVTAPLSITVNVPPPPSISYSSPQSYITGRPVAPLAPANTGGLVDVPGYSNNMNLFVSNQKPIDIAVDSARNVYVSDSQVTQVLKFNATGGTPVNIGTGLSQPGALTTDRKGNVYVVDNGSNTVYEIRAANDSTITIATGFGNPMGVAVDAGGNVYVSDSMNSTIYKISAADGAKTVFASGFNHQDGIAVDGAGNIYVADSLNGLVKEILASNGNTVTIGSGFSHPNKVAVDGSGDVYVLDHNTTPIIKIFAGSGTKVPLITTMDGFPMGVTDVAVDMAGNVYISDNFNNVINKIKPVGGFYIGPFLPAGLSFNGATGVISGTPTVNSPATNYTVTAYNYGGNGKAVVNIKTALSNNATLSNLKTSNGVLTPAFAPGTTSYTRAVPNTTTSIIFTPSTADTAARVTVNGIAVPSGMASQPVPLLAGSNAVPIVVTAQDGTKLTYTVTVNRALSADATLSNLSINPGTIRPAFVSTTTAYTAAVGNGITSITVTPTTNDSTATVKVRGVTVTSGTASGPINLVVGANTIAVVITAQNGVTTKNYKITVTRAVSSNAKLSSLTTSNGVLTPGFNNTQPNYTRNVPSSTDSITLTATAVNSGATIMIAGQTTPSGVGVRLALAPGNNYENIQVTAQDNVTTMIYSVNVIRAMGAANTVYEPLGVGRPFGTLQIAEDGVNVHAGVTPNGDGVNDFLQIDGISAYPDNKLRIMNVNGTLVFEANGYDNSTRVFDGHSNKSGTMQLPGTYFYSLEYTRDGVIKHKTGFLVLKY